MKDWHRCNFYCPKRGFKPDMKTPCCWGTSYRGRKLEGKILDESVGTMLVPSWCPAKREAKS